MLSRRPELGPELGPELWRIGPRLATPYLPGFDCWSARMCESLTAKEVQLLGTGGCFCLEARLGRVLAHSAAIPAMSSPLVVPDR